MALAQRRLAPMLTSVAKLHKRILAYHRSKEHGYPSIDPNAILAPARERVKIGWRFVPCVICVELARLMHHFQCCFRPPASPND